jgi:hypothetical protein
LIQFIREYMSFIGYSSWINVKPNECIQWIMSKWWNDSGQTRSWVMKKTLMRPTLGSSRSSLFSRGRKGGSSRRLLTFALRTGAENSNATLVSKGCVAVLVAKRILGVSAPPEEPRGAGVLLQTSHLSRCWAGALLLAIALVNAVCVVVLGSKMAAFDCKIWFKEVGIYGWSANQYSDPCPRAQRWARKAYVREPIDYRCEDQKKVQANLGVIEKVLTSSFIKPRSSPPKNEPFSQDMHLKIPILSRGLKLSNSKPGCKVSVLHFFWEIEITNGFLTSSLFGKVPSSAFYSRINLCFTARKRIGVWNCHETHRHPLHQ